MVEKGLLDQIVEDGRLAKDVSGRERGKDLVKEFVAQVLDGSMTVSKDAEAMINARIAQIDHLLSIQLNEILHHASFQKLEATWRGLKYLVDQSETSDHLKIKIINASKKELLRDLQRAPEFDQSALFKKVYEEEFGIFGGAPFAGLVGDYEFGRGPEDIELLEKISNVAAAAHAPFLSAASPDMFNLDSFTQLDAPRDMAKIFDTTEYAKWKSFRAVGRLALRGAHLPAHPDAPALRQGDQAGGGLRVRGARGRLGPQQVPVGQRGLRPGRADEPTPSPCMAGARRSAAWRAAAWWRACRCTTSTPMRGTWP